MSGSQNSLGCTACDNNTIYLILFHILRNVYHKGVWNIISNMSCDAFAIFLPQGWWVIDTGVHVVGPLLLRQIDLIQTCISNHMPSELWYELLYPFPNFNAATVEVWEWISNFIPHFITDVIEQWNCQWQLNTIKDAMRFKSSIVCNAKKINAIFKDSKTFTASA